ncbi:MAG: dockerin type I repeat-containing protein [Prevotella sp.]|nr:dockerin type I repeat-containing protein [Prevotella sp.]
MRNSCEPNEIYGTTSPSGSIYLTDSVQTVNYRIQFENDSVFATAAAQTVIVRDTLDTRYLDLSTFTPTFVKIADDMYEVDGSPNFVKTIDMRPRINTIVQVNCDLDKEQGIATWTFRSLDPLTMEPVTDVERGFLPVNYDGISGIGEVAFDIGLKQPLPNGTEISNRSGNIFDSNEPVMTPYWTNIIDAVAPESAITSYHIVNDSTMTLRFNGIDNLSGVWKYDVYACYGEAAAPFRVAEDVTENECDVRIYQGIVHGFFVVATDSAGNREQKFAPEVTIPIGSLRGDANGDGAVNISDVMLMVSNILGDHGVMYIFENADINGDGEVNISDVTGVVDMILNGTSSSVPQNARTALDSHLRVESNGGRGTVCLVGDERYTGCQMHLLLPEECELKDIKMNNRCKDHEMACRDLGGGHYSIVIYSLQAKEFEGGDTPLLDLTVDGIHADDVEVTDILFTNRQYESVVLPDAGHGVTGITTTSVGAKGEKTYDTQGVEVNTPAKGVYIQRGKKVVVH